MWTSHPIHTRKAWHKQHHIRSEGLQRISHRYVKKCSDFAIVSDRSSGFKCREFSSAFEACWIVQIFILDKGHWWRANRPALMILSGTCKRCNNITSSHSHHWHRRTFYETVSNHLHCCVGLLHALLGRRSGNTARTIPHLWHCFCLLIIPEYSTRDGSSSSGLIHTSGGITVIPPLSPYRITINHNCRTYELA